MYGYDYLDDAMMGMDPMMGDMGVDPMMGGMGVDPMMGINSMGYIPQANMKVYQPDTQFEFDPDWLMSIGFTSEQINTLSYIVNVHGKATTQLMVQGYGIPYEQAQILKYLYDICIGKVRIDTDDDLCKHLRKLFGRHKRIGIGDLPVSKINEVPRKALIGKIPKDTPFAIWNSKQYPPLERLYHVVDVSGSNIIIETNRLPVLKWKQDRFIDGVLKILTEPKDGKIQVSINKEYCKLCNRFVIVASLRRPEFHHGLVEIICYEGTRVYVFVDTLSAKKYSRYGNNTQRIYDYGFLPNEILPKLLACASKIGSILMGVKANNEPANMEFEILPPEKVEEEQDDIEVE